MFFKREQQARRPFPSPGRKRSLLNRRSGRSYLVLAGVLTLSLMAAHRALDANTGAEKGQRIQASSQAVPLVSFPAPVPRGSSTEQARLKPEPPPGPPEGYVPPYARLAPKPLASAPETTGLTNSAARTEPDDMTRGAVQIARSALETSRKILDALQQEDATKNGSTAQPGDSVGKTPLAPPTPNPLPLTTEAKTSAVTAVQLPIPAPRRIVEEEKSAVALPPTQGATGFFAKVAPPLPAPLPVASTAVATSAPSETTARVVTTSPALVAMAEPVPLRIAHANPAANPQESTNLARTDNASADHPNRDQALEKRSMTVSQAGRRVLELVKKLRPGAVPPPQETAAATKSSESVAPVPKSEPEVVAVAIPQTPVKGPEPQAAPEPATISGHPPVQADTGTPRSKANHALVAQMQHTFKSAHRTVKDFVRDGDHLAAILGRNEVDQATTQEVADAARPVYDLAHHLQPGKGFRLAFGSEGELTALSYPVNDEETFLLTRDDHNQFVPKMVERKLERRVRSVSSIVNGSLFVASRRAGLSQQMGIKLANLFEWDVDFARDIRTGDRFTVIYEEHLENGRPVRDGEILAAEFVNQGNSYRVIRYTDPSGRTGYFDPDGQNVQKMFIRAPVDFLRISSQFSMKRKHPVFGFTRAHKGVDYAAPIGTPVRAAGDGVVTFRGRKSSYGNLVAIRHNTKYSTGYAHLSGFVSGLHVGSRVRQGQIVGHVGMTGVTTGPHLHYEVRLNGEAINPLSIQSPAAMPVVARYMPDFRNQSRQLVAMLDRSETMVASLPSGSRR
ncbi:MAG: peptidoglycan DD-metalloendopeptidase family protein [Magnetococcales bacterium]|nr:peptidoglycan DD-metalloendopeptidase family protein [Magnetococcales bacterium]